MVSKGANGFKRKCFHAFDSQGRACVLDCAIAFGMRGFVRIPAFVHSPQVNAGKRGATLVPFAGVR